MRIALVHPYAWPHVRRGGERYLDDLSWYFRSAGDHVDVITGTARRGSRVPTASGTDVHLRHGSIEVLRRRGLTTTETFGLRALPHLLRTRYDVVHTLIPSGAAAARTARQATLFTLLGHPDPEVFRHRPHNRRLFDWAVTHADGVAALSEPSAGQAERLFGVRPMVLPPGVRIDGFRANLTARTGPPRILFASAHDRPQKGLDVLLRAFEKLLPEVPDARLWLGGPGDPAWALDRMPDRVRGAVDVLGTGAPADLPARYAEATVTVLPSRNEAFGLVLIESLACGTPVIGATPGGPSDIVTEEVGRLVTSGDDDALLHALHSCIDLARDPHVPAKCREHARRWDWASSIGGMHRSAYERVASTAGR